MSDKSDLRTEGFVSAHSVVFSHSGKEGLAAGAKGSWLHGICIQEAESNAFWFLVHFFIFMKSGIQVYGMVPPIFMADLPTSMSLS